MTRPIALLVALAGFLALAAGPAPVAHAAPEPAAETHGGDAHGVDHGANTKHGVVPNVMQAVAPAITALVVFGIVAYIASVVVWPKINQGLNDRANKIREEIAAAEAARAQAKSALEEYEKSLSQARAEAQRMLDETKSKQAELAAELRAKADRELGQMRDKAMRDIDAARRAALGEIYNESVALATTMAGKILQREVTATDQDRLLDESLAELGAAR